MIEITKEGVLIQLVNFLITLVGLNILLFKPIRGIVKKRKDLMAGQLEKIDEFTSKAETKVSDYEAQLAAARKDGNDLRNKLREEGSAEEQKLMAAAGDKASKTLQAARADIDAQVKAAMDSLSKDVETYAAKATDKILGQA